MSNFLRGGQVSLHKLRMHGQLGKFMLRAVLATFLLAIAYTYYHDLKPYEWQIGGTIIKAELIGSFNPDYVIEYPNKYGQPLRAKIKDFQKQQHVKSVVQKFEKTLHKGLLLAAIGIGIETILLLTVFFFIGRRINSTKQLRGAFLISKRQLRRAIQKHNRAFKRYYTPFKIADFAYPITGKPKSWSAGEQSHTLLVASTGAGKTQIIKKLVYELSQRKQKAIIVDVKGDYIKNFYRTGDVILNPLDARGQNWSFFNETNALKGFTTIAKSLMPKDSKNDPIWTEAARAVLAEMANMYSNEDMSLAEFADIILKSDLATLASLLAKTPAAKLVNVDIEKAALSVLMVLSTYLRPLKLYRQSQKKFSITDWIQDNTQNNFLFIATCAEAKGDLNPLVCTQVDIAITALKSLKEESNSPKVWFILDEVSYFEQAIPTLKDGLTTARSYGGCFVLGTQDISSLKHIYSREEAETIVNNCRTKIFLNIEGHDTAAWASESLGEGEMEEWHESLSYGSHEMRDGMQVNKSRSMRRVVIPTEFSLLKAGEGYIKFAGYVPAQFKSKKLQLARIADGYVENKQLHSLLQQEIAEGIKHRQQIEARLKAKAEEDNDEKHMQATETVIDKVAARQTSILPQLEGEGSVW